MHPSRVLTVHPTCKNHKSTAPAGPSLPSSQPCVHNFHSRCFRNALCLPSSPVPLAGPHRQAHLAKASPEYWLHRGEYFLSSNILLRRRDGCSLDNWPWQQLNPSSWAGTGEGPASAAQHSCCSYLCWQSFSCRNGLMHPKHLHTNRGEAMHFNFFIFVFPVFDLLRGMYCHTALPTVSRAGKPLVAAENLL